ncbi:L,D-transpeptidase [Streptantibioticus silvisoli]|uniref:L,D-transpeptidase n=1 Tax=Streptantibioticus silvisoli TaxID=2705255 RepID=UPI0027E2C5C6|nr:Ig-like domain-containing protein [Streptantibioticus silvisoli]
MTNAAVEWVRGHRRAAVAALGAAGAAACLTWLALPAGGGPHEAVPLPPPRTATGYFTPESGSTVGTAMIVSVVFDHPVTRRSAVSRAVRVLATPGVPVAGHWFGDRRLDLRPERFWAAGTLVDLRLRLDGVETAPGRYGTQSKDIVFRVGREQADEVDAARHTLTVRRGGRTVRVLPVSTGDPGHATYDGTMVITQKFARTRMNGATVGFGGAYDIADVPHAMRLTDSGTFLHGNYWSPRGVFGAANTSHGCVGLPDARGGAPDSPAGWLYGQSLVGDPVTVTHSTGPRVGPGNGLGGWNLPWREWTATG